ncbi:hypothetical protein TRFO_00924 [Tritrichomonas foetus]|uniref:Uncharacterized protein n=1 Tax=Tritrichomonas foetus TaxID=1144522 RepID=A0A1J4L2A7_9EUKA|nr:hypothetical protein TRFO_00924 [Tritrichomonas foetus]|eukprot:OHT17647.1 hypothetical protein TRFO_00924 [Tritrichomonas foetus]
MSKQGLPSAHTHGGERQVADKSYFIGILRNKINDIVKEIERLEHEIDQRKRGQSIQVNLAQSVAALRKEITESEAELADYNVLADRVQNGTPLDDMIAGFQALEQANLQCEEDVNKTFKEKRDLESIVVEQEKKVQEMMQGNGAPELQAMAHEIEVIEQKCQEMRSATGDLKGKTREELLQMVKDATKEIGDTEKQIQDEQRALSFVQGQIKNIEDREGDLQTERGKQYLKLLQREKDMNNFLQNFPTALEQAKQDLAQCQRRVFDILVNTSRDLESVSELPTIDNFKQMQTDLAYKERQMQDAQSTMQTLQHEVENRRREFEDLKNVDQKIKDEIEQIKLRMREMEDEMPNFADVDSVRQEGEIRKKGKVEERDQLKAQLHNLRKATNALATKYNETRAQVRSNEINSKLHLLEKEIRARATENNTTAESIEENRRRTNYAIVKRAAMNIVSEINSLL